MIILTAPSGSGKSTIAHHLLNEIPELDFSISATNRPKREHEENGKHYYFYSDEEFRRLIKEDKLAEWEEVYPGRFYGTLNSEIDKAWENDKFVLFDIDVHGAITLKNKYSEQALTLFIKVPSIEELEKRLRDRGSETKDSLERRLKRARYEYTMEKCFDVVIINDELHQAKVDSINAVRAYLFNKEVKENA